MSILQTLIVPGMAMIAALALPAGTRNLDTDDFAVPRAPVATPDLSGDGRGQEELADALQPETTGRTAPRS